MSGIIITASAPTPHLQDVTAYLLHSGWQLASRSARWATYLKTISGDAIALDVPLVTQAPVFIAYAMVPFRSTSIRSSANGGRVQ